MSGRFGGGGVKCAICGKTAYSAEQVSFEKVIYHVKCFKCVVCGQKMGPDKAKMHEGKLYDLRCYARAGFAHQQTKVVWKKKTGTDGAKSSGGSSKFGGGGTPCAICGKTVYPGEMASFDGKKYHQKCLACSECGKVLAPAKVSKYEDKLYCPKCWKVGGYSNKQTKTGWKKSAESKTTSGSKKGGSGRYGGGGTPCVVCGKNVYAGERLSFDKLIYHPKCFKCCFCKKTIRSASDGQLFTDAKTGEKSVWCRKCFKSEGKAREQTRSANTWKKSTTSGGGSSKFGGGGTKCITCNKTVYQAEMVTYEKLAFHQQCFKCSDCNQKANISNAGMYKKQIKCGKCWNLNRYKDKQTKDAIQKKDGEKKKKTTDSRFKNFGGGSVTCKTCSKSVYPAEKIVFEKESYHNKCLLCSVCGIALNAANAQYTKHTGKVIVYCLKCYNTGGHGKAKLKESTATTETTEETGTVEEEEASTRPTLD